MPKLIYTPKALDDLQEIKAYVAKQLELFSGEGPCLEKLIEYPTDYQYLAVKPNYVFYRGEGDAVRVIRILNEKQDFLQTLFGISSISEEREDYWGDQGIM